jgi:CRISPR-associated endoribonuclease Cas6
MKSFEIGDVNQIRKGVKKDMRFKLKFDLQHELLDADYRPTIVSYIKNALSQDNPVLYHALYGEGATQKLFAFAPYLPAPVFNGDTIKIDKLNLEILFTTSDYPTFINLYNAFLKQRFKPYPLKFNNMLTLKSIVMIRERVIEKDTALIKMLSPLVVRRHDKRSNQDQYFVFDQPDFESAWRDTLKPLLAAVATPDDIQVLTLAPLQCKKVVVRVFGQNIDTTIGTLQLNGKRSLLNYLLSMGISSRRAQGFGVFDVIG